MQAPLLADPFYVQPKDSPAKKAVLRAALSLFVDNGIAETTVRDIAAAAAFSNPVIFKYFATRDALAVQLFESCFRNFSQRLERATASHLPLARRLQGLIDTYGEAAQNETDTFLYLHENSRALSPLISDELRSFSLPRRMRKLLQEAQAAGLVAAHEDADLLCAALQGFFLALARRAHAGSALASHDAVSRLANRIIQAH